MKKVNTSPISGTQELTPNDQAVFNKLKNKINEVYHRHGFLDIETPTIERTEILLAKAGGDTEKQIYRVFKTAETANESDQALRFDHTVPLARYVVEHENDLVFPFKVSQIGLNFRGERAQKGRFREFYQCDIDIIGRNNLTLAHDADIISTLLDAYTSFGFNTPVIARISNRKILSGLLKALSLEAKSTDIYSIIDHSEKVESAKTEDAFREIGVSEDDTKKLLAFIDIHGDRDRVVKNLNELQITDPTFQEGVSELDCIMRLLESMNFKSNILADMKIVRGLDYYTGTVFEFFLPEYREIGSIGGGGRYENLTGYFTDQKFPGVGGSIGLTRLFYVLREHNLLSENFGKILDYAIVPISKKELDFAFSTAAKLRQQNYSVTVVLTDKKLSDKLTYAAKLAENGIVIGESEVESGDIKSKNFATGEANNLTI